MGRWLLGRGMKLTEASHSHAVRQSPVVRHSPGRRPQPCYRIFDTFAVSTIGNQRHIHSTTKSPKELARCCETTHKESQPIHGNGCRPSGFPPQIFCTMQYTTILNLGASPPGRLEILTASNGFSSRSSYGFIYARWLAALAGTGYFFEASPRACRCSHL